jgi:ribosomal protein S18 acetylase RimI-like enzyme
MHPLDNVIWTALNTRQASLAESFGEARRFQPEITLLGAFREPSGDGWRSLGQLVKVGEAVCLFLEQRYEARPGWEFAVGAPMLEMVCEKTASALKQKDPIAAALSAPHFAELSAEDAPQMVELAKLTNPGPFNVRALELGTFVGIRVNGKLVAMAGERVKIPGYSEVSGICTHPDHLGKGYAGLLTREVMRRMHERAEIPFLHVREDNRRAISLYQRLGFQERKHLHYAVLRKIAGRED